MHTFLPLIPGNISLENYTYDVCNMRHLMHLRKMRSKFYDFYFTIVYLLLTVFLESQHSTESYIDKDRRDFAIITHLFSAT